MHRELRDRVALEHHVLGEDQDFGTSVTPAVKSVSLLRFFFALAPAVSSSFRSSFRILGMSSSDTK